MDSKRRSCSWLAAALLLGLGACSRPAAPPPNRPAAQAISKESLPDPGLTPGRIRRVTLEEICRPGTARRARAVSASVKRRVYASYARTHQTGICCEVDHLIPLALGGSNSPRNLWPQLYAGQWTAAEKDKLENRLHKLVCSGQLDLTTAQEAISSNWVAAYREYVAP